MLSTLILLSSVTSVTSVTGYTVDIYTLYQAPYDVLSPVISIGTVCSLPDKDHQKNQQLRQTKWTRYSSSSLVAQTFF